MFKEYLKQRGISIYYLAKNTGVSYSTLNDFVNGKVDIENCKFGMIKKLSDALELTLDEMYKLCRNKKMVYSKKYEIAGELKVVHKSYHIVFDDGDKRMNIEVCPVNAINDVFAHIAALWDMEEYFAEKEMREAYEIYIDAKKHTDNAY